MKRYCRSIVEIIPKDRSKYIEKKKEIKTIPKCSVWYNNFIINFIIQTITDSILFREIYTMSFIVLFLISFLLKIENGENDEY